jgi:hypothetical protein
MLGLEKFWNGWLTGKSSWARMSEDKVHTKDSFGMWEQYDPTELPEVSTADPGLDGVLQLICNQVLYASVQARFLVC